MVEEAQRLAGRLLDEGTKAKAFFERLDDHNWDAMIYTDGSEWSLRQVLAHFSSSEISLGRLVENILGGGSGSPEDFDLDAYNARKVSELNEMGIPELIDRYWTARQNNAALVSGLSSAELNRTGRHPYLGIVPLIEIIKMIYLHNQIHLRDIRKRIG